MCRISMRQKSESNQEYGGMFTHSERASFDMFKSSK